MVHWLFQGNSPAPDENLLDPGCGGGEFIAGVLRWHDRRSILPPTITGVELNPSLALVARARFADRPRVRIVNRDFLQLHEQPFNFIVGNPPYVPITGIPRNERARLRTRFLTARGRFDLYMLFFEKALRMLAPQGRLVFVTPEKFLYVASAAPLRRILAQMDVRFVRQMSEDAFGDLVTYPTVTAVVNSVSGPSIRLVDRSGDAVTIQPPGDGTPWRPGHEASAPARGMTLKSVVKRISCGVATGADDVFVVRPTEIPSALKRFGHPCLAGRDLTSDTTAPSGSRVMLIPYDRAGKLLSEASLGALGEYLREAPRKVRLKGRSCSTRKPWYAFHDSVPMAELTSPKIVCKDITAKPQFWMEPTGEIVPRHSVYYIVPRRKKDLEPIAQFLNSPSAARWLRANCQHASSGFLRLQSSTLKQMPVPPRLLSSLSIKSTNDAAASRQLLLSEALD